METIADLDEALLRVLERHTAGSPMDEKLKWTNLKRHAIAQLLKEAGIDVGVTVVDQLLEKHNFRITGYLIHDPISPESVAPTLFLGVPGWNPCVESQLPHPHRPQLED